MSINETLIVISLILILIDIFFISDYSTHVAYLLITFTISKEISKSILYQILFGIIIWFCLVVFHYLLWRKVLEHINDKVIAPTKHVGGFESFIGKEGIIKKVEGKRFIQVDDEIHLFETSKNVKEGEIYKVTSIKSNKLII
jgi:membrane protein implicated in regulation of membrane protease activity